MRLLMIAPPGAGKGTQAARIAQHFHLDHIASGNLLREAVRAGTDLGQRARRYLDEGELVPDDLVLAIVSDRVKRANPAGFILDGFPRTVEQARAADRLFAESGGPVVAVICLDVDRDESVRRLLARAGQERRSDDQEPTIRHRLAVFDTMTKPLLQYYGDRGLVMAIDGERPIDTVTEEILDQLTTRTSKR